MPSLRSRKPKPINCRRWLPLWRWRLLSASRRCPSLYRYLGRRLGSVWNDSKRKQRISNSFWKQIDLPLISQISPNQRNSCQGYWTRWRTWMNTRKSIENISKFYSWLISQISKTSGISKRNSQSRNGYTQVLSNLTSWPKTGTHANSNKSMWNY